MPNSVGQKRALTGVSLLVTEMIPRYDGILVMILCVLGVLLSRLPNGLLQIIEATTESSVVKKEYSLRAIGPVETRRAAPPCISRLGLTTVMITEV